MRSQSLSRMGWWTGRPCHRSGDAAVRRCASGVHAGREGSGQRYHALIRCPSSTDGIRIATLSRNSRISAAATLRHCSVEADRISVQNGRATLYGVVDSDMDKQLAYTRAMQAPNVFQVTNDLVFRKRDGKEEVRNKARATLQRSGAIKAAQFSRRRAAPSFWTAECLIRMHDANLVSDCLVQQEDYGQAGKRRQGEIAKVIDIGQQ